MSKARLEIFTTDQLAIIGNEEFLLKTAQSLISSKESTSQTRINSISLITTIIKKSAGNFSDYFGYLCNNGLNVLAKGNLTDEKLSYISLYKEIFISCKKRADLTRDIVSEFLPKLVTLFLKEGFFGSDDFADASFEFCGKMFEYFSSIMKPFYEKLVNVCALRMFSYSFNEASLNCLCCLLNCCNAGGKVGCNERLLLTSQKLVGTIEKVLNYLLVDFKEEKFYSTAFPFFDLPLANEEGDYLETISLFSKYIDRCLYALSLSLSLKYVGPIQIPLKQILLILQRISNLSSSSLLKTEALKDRAANVILTFSRLHVSSLTVLSSLFSAFGSKLVRFRTLISGIVENSIYFLSLKKGLEKDLACCLAKIMETYPYKFTKSCENMILAFMKNQMTPQVIDNQKLEKETKQKGKRKAVFETNTTNLAVISDVDAFYYALKLFNHSVKKISDIETRKQLDQLIVSHLLKLQTSSRSPYISSIEKFYPKNNRIVLYDDLLKSVLNSPYLECSFLYLVLELFKFGLDDESNEVVLLCKHALDCLEKIIHPCVRLLGFCEETSGINDDEVDEDDDDGVDSAVECNLEDAVEEKMSVDVLYEKRIFSEVIADQEDYTESVSKKAKVEREDGKEDFKENEAVVISETLSIISKDIVAVDKCETKEVEKVTLSVPDDKDSDVENIVLNDADPDDD